MGDALGELEGSDGGVGGVVDEESGEGGAGGGVLDGVVFDFERGPVIAAGAEVAERRLQEDAAALAASLAERAPFEPVLRPHPAAATGGRQELEPDEGEPRKLVDFAVAWQRRRRRRRRGGRDRQLWQPRR